MLFDPNSPDVPLRHMCRNPHCGAQLKTPAANSRDAFCCEGCHEIYYRTHCRVCEQLFRSKNRRRTVCGRSSCRHEFQRHPEQFWGSRYPRPRSGHNEEKSLAKSTPKTDVKSDREWRQVAGPKLSETGFRAAVLGADKLPASAANTASIEYQTAALRRAQSCRFNPDSDQHRWRLSLSECTASRSQPAHSGITDGVDLRIERSRNPGRSQHSGFFASNRLKRANND